MSTLIIDGIVYKEQKHERELPKQYDVQDQGDEVPVNEPTELGEALRELNNDTLQSTRMSGIDMRTRLHFLEVAPILAIDTLVAMRFLPVSMIHFTRQKKRLAVSLQGKGREEMVRVIGGKQEQDQVKGKGMLSRFFGPKSPPAAQQGGN